MQPVPHVDYTATSVRAQWADLPGGVRAAVERAAGGRVAHAEPSVTSGFSGGFAAVLHLAAGRRVFAKAGSGVNPYLLTAYAREGEVLAALPASVPAPRLVGTASLAPGDAGDEAWEVVVAEAADGRIPQPWDERSFAAVHHACVAVAAALDPPPAALEPLDTVAADYAEDAAVLGAFPALAAGRRPLPPGQPGWLPGRYGELEVLVARAAEALAGHVGCHGDLRADNVLVDGDRVVVVDWNYLATGPAWLDVVGLLPVARADGVDVGAWVRRSPLLRDADPEHVDVWLAVVAAYMLAHADQPLWPGGHPAVRVHQRRYARLFLDWLAERRGWA
ncbi:MAG TPA: phosphotransferase [Kineosporiaceae bacterium]|jgi:hypothetical protein|nr:phosphotransferase [Kineosporiaceae bacterium]